MASRNSNQVIQRLLEAENESETMIRKAKENRAKKLKEAQASAEVEVQKFKETEDARFAKEYQAKYADEEKMTELETETKKEIENVKTDYRKNRDQVIAYLIKKCVDVDLSVSEKEKRQLGQLFGAKREAF